MKIQGAIFDMDGTLVDTLMLWDVMWEHFGKLYRGIEGFRPDPLFEKELRTMVLRDAMVCIHDELGMGADADELLREAYSCFTDYYRNRVEMKPGAREFLDRLQAAGIPMILASATDPVLIELGLAHCDMNKYFKAVLSCATIGRARRSRTFIWRRRRSLAPPPPRRGSLRILMSPCAPPMASVCRRWASMTNTTILTTKS